MTLAGLGCIIIPPVGFAVGTLALARSASKERFNLTESNEFFDPLATGMWLKGFHRLQQSHGVRFHQ